MLKLNESCARAVRGNMKNSNNTKISCMMTQALPSPYKPSLVDPQVVQHVDEPLRQRESGRNVTHDGLPGSSRVHDRWHRGKAQAIMAQRQRECTGMGRLPV